jgi:hypothetical protein
MARACGSQKLASTQPSINVSVVDGVKLADVVRGRLVAPAVPLTRSTRHGEEVQFGDRGGSSGSSRFSQSSMFSQLMQPLSSFLRSPQWSCSRRNP